MMNIEQQAEYVVTTLKKQFMNNKIGTAGNATLEEIADVLSLFDYHVDKTIAMSELSVDKPENLESWLMFKGDALKTRWHETINLAVENKAYLICPDTAKKLLDFLIKNLTESEKTRGGVL